MASNPFLDETHDPALSSWVEGASGHRDFPIQNLPLCIFSNGSGQPRAGAVIGDYLLDLQAVGAAGILDDADAGLFRVFTSPDLNAYCALPARERQAVRRVLSRLLSDPASSLRPLASSVLVRRDDVRLEMPARIGDYTDFFAGIHHAVNAGRMFRPDNPLLPNYWHVPIAYHGRASSIGVSGTDFRRPLGQTVAHGSTEPQFGPAKRLDFELELAIWIGGGNDVGQPIPVSRAGDAIAGFGLLNDWSARDIQAWESQPLGPFLGKSFFSTVSPLLVTTEALAPFRASLSPRSAEQPAPLPYLMDEGDQQLGVFDCTLEMLLSTERMRREGEAPVALTRASGSDLVWTPAQLVAHHTVGGCNLRPGDLFGSGTVSSAGANGHGSMLEMSKGGREALTLPNGESRTFLEDGDEVILRGWCEREGFARISLGEARGTVLPSLQDFPPQAG